MSPKPGKLDFLEGLKSKRNMGIMVIVKDLE